MAKGTQKKALPVQVASARDTAAGLPDIVGQSIASLATECYNRGSSSGILHKPGIVWPNIDSLTLPYSCNNDGYYSAREPVVLCQKAYYRIGIFKTAIDTMADLCNTPIHFFEGNAQSLKFFQGWWKKINGWDLKDQFFRELFRSGNVFLYEASLSLKASDVLKLSQNYAKTIQIPGRYIILNPASLAARYVGAGTPIYSQILTHIELQQLKNQQNDDDGITIYKDIRSAIDKYVGSSASSPYGQTIIELDPTKLHTVFYQKQDYEPFATPMGYCVLDDLNLLREMKKADLIVSKAVEYMLLLITMGAPEDEGGVNPKAMEAVKQAFSKEQLGKALIADYTTKADFVLPDLTKVMFQGKYDEIKNNIANGLMNMFFSDDQFANVVAKLKVFIKKLENAQQLFIEKFLQPEIKRISKILNFKSYPKVQFEPIDIEDQTNFQRVVAQLLTVGILTPKDGLELLQTGLYPDFDTLKENQTNFQSDKQNGLFQPLQGGPKDNLDTQLQINKQQNQHDIKMEQMFPKPTPIIGPGGGGKPGPAKKPAKPASPAGRPSGTKSPQTTKTVKPARASIIDADETKFSQIQLVENTILAQNLEDSLTEAYKKKKNKKRLNSIDKEIVSKATESIVSNCSPSEWLEFGKEFQIPALNEENMASIIDIQNEFGIVESRMAALLFHSRLEE